METIILDLRSSYGLTFKKWFCAIAIIFITAYIICILSSVISADILIILLMVIILGQVIVNLYTLKPVKVTFDDKSIAGLVSPWKAISLTWNQIARIEVRMFAMDIQTKDGRTEHIDLGEINYEQQKSVKPQIIELAKSKGITVRTG